MTELYLAAGPGPRPAPRAGSKPLCCDWESFTSLQGAGGEPEAWEDYVPAGLCDAVVDEAERIADSWYQDGGEDFTVFEGVSLGRAFRWTLLTLTVQPACKFLAAILAAIEEHEAGAVRCEVSVPELYRMVLRCAAQDRLGLNLALVERGPAGAGSIDWALPDVSLGRAKTAALRLVNGLSRLLHRRDSRPVLAVSYYPTLGPLIDLASKPGFPFRLVLTDTPDKRRLPDLAVAGAEVLVEHRTEPRFSAEQDEVLSTLARHWAARKQDPGFRARFSTAGVGLWPLVETVLDGFFETRLRPLAWAVAGLDAAWRREKPAVALLPYDDPPLQNLLCAVAAKHKTPSVTVLHGLPELYRPPFGRVHASHFAVWGPRLRALYEETGSVARSGPDGPSPEVTGNPYFDLHARLPRRAPPTRLGRILVISYPQRLWIMLASELDPQRYALAAARSLAKIGAGAVFKLHPAESLTHYLDLLRDHPHMTVVKDKPIQECLLEADLVIGSFSTALIEAMLLRRPVLLVNLTRSPHVAPFDGSWGITPIRSEGELAAALSRIKADPVSALAELCRPYDRILDEFVGPVDGRSCRRLLERLEALVAGKQP